MKLYTEEHLKIFYHLGKIDGFIGRQDDVDELIKNYPPIEIPSDEEIEKEAEITFNIPEDKIGDVYFCANIAHLRKGFRIGVKKIVTKYKEVINE